MLDEPFNGLDPEGIVWMRGFLRGLAAQGRAVLVSSHLMGELQDTADHLVVVGRGRVIADGSTAGLLAAASGDQVTVRTAAPAAAMAVLARAEAAVTEAGPGTVTVAGLAAERITGLLGAGGVPFAEVTAHRASLEEAYLELTRDAAEFRAAQAGEQAAPPNPGGGPPGPGGGPFGPGAALPDPGPGAAGSGSGARDAGAPAAPEASR